MWQSIIRTQNQDLLPEKQRASTPHQAPQLLRCAPEEWNISLSKPTGLTSLRAEQNFPGGPLVWSLPAGAGDVGSVPRPGESHTSRGRCVYVPQLLKPECTRSPRSATKEWPMPATTRESLPACEQRRPEEPKRVLKKPFYVWQNPLQIKIKKKKNHFKKERSKLTNDSSRAHMLRLTCPRD